MPINFWLNVIFIFGLIIGSFLNVVIFRIDELETIWHSRSHCQSCRHLLAWSDLIPFFSFILLKTRCRYCRAKISWQYPLVELGTGLVFTLSFYQMMVVSQLNLGLFFIFLVIASAYIVIFVYDLKTMTIPMEILAMAGIASIIYQLILWQPIVMLEGLLGALVMALIPILIIIIGKIIFKREAMGMGDFYLALVLGLTLNIPKGVLVLLLSFLIGGIISMGLILFQKIKLGSFTEIAFGPFLISSFFIVFLWGDRILKYLETIYL